MGNSLGNGKLQLCDLNWKKKLQTKLVASLNRPTCNVSFL